VYKKQDCKFKKWMFELLKSYQNGGYMLFIVTNKSGIGGGVILKNIILIWIILLMIKG